MILALIRSIYVPLLIMTLLLAVMVFIWGVSTFFIALYRAL